MHKIFIDGQVGTTGLQIHDLLQHRPDIELLQIAEAERKSDAAKFELMQAADVAILCLPDTAARDMVSLAGDLPVKILDASTAHRVSPGWVYGLPELAAGQRDAIRGADRVSNPGCYPTGFLLALAPLVRAGIVPAALPISVHAVSGFSGGGRPLIGKYLQAVDEAAGTSRALRPYALSLEHKHLLEMQTWSGLVKTPLFMPAVGNFYQGMLVEIPLFNELLSVADPAEQIYQAWQEQYGNEPCVKLHPVNPVQALDEGFLDPELNNNTNRVDLFIFASQEHCLLIARLDNLGKGAAGAAVQNLNLMLGCNELEGLQLQP
jgi:N-acetyl-gamma-glutamyl-phosphate reductase